MSSSYTSYIWEIQQQDARRQYGFARHMLLKPVLMDARTGNLDPDWREGLTDATLGRPSIPRLADSNLLAAYEIATMDVQPWEPHTGLGWRAALDAWYAAIVDLDDCNDRTNYPMPGSESDAPLGVREFHATVQANPVLADFATRAAEGRRRWRDWHGAWYHAGLAGGGLDVDWRGWYRDRIATWTSGCSGLEGPSAIKELEMMESGQKDHMEILPSYWL